ncbi:MAG: hypothetical protein Q7J32_02915 [Sphingomonadaceae bacterium]|nr:hypothetical protein [Sphingomonadaceae bacterium]
MSVLSRRSVLASAGMAAAAAAIPAAAQTGGPATTAAKPAPLIDRLIETARQNRLPVEYAGGRFSGAGWDRLVAEGRAAHFFLIGEEHGVAEVPKLVGQLAAALKPAGYERLAIEVSPPIADLLEAAATEGYAGIERFMRANPPGVAFYSMREEARLIADIAAGGGYRLWGLDYEVMGDPLIVEQLAGKAPASARAAVAALRTAAAHARARLLATRQFENIFSFSGDPELVRAVRRTWPDPDPASAWILETLEETLEINALWVGGKGWASNARRAAFLRSNLRRHWLAEKAKGRAPKVLFKFGASHAARGRSATEVYDIGEFAPAIAELEGGHSFHLLLGAGVGAQQAVFNPATLDYAATPADGSIGFGMAPIAALADPDVPTLIDLRPLRPLMSTRQAKTADPDLVRAIHGFDALLVLSGSTPSTGMKLT